MDAFLNRIRSAAVLLAIALGAASAKGEDLDLALLTSNQADTAAGANLNPANPPKDTAPDNGHPYRAIVARNAFRLKEPAPMLPPPTNPPAAPEPAKIDVKLAGIARIKGIPYAYLMMPDPDRPGQFVYPTLTDNPEHGRVRHGSGLEVREIDMKKQVVRVVNGGIETTLNFQDNGVKTVPGTAPAAPGKPGGIPAPGMQGAPNLMRSPNATTSITPAAGAPGAMGENKAGSGSEPIVFSRNANRASGGYNNPTGNAFTPVVGNTPNMNAGGVVSTPGTVNSTIPARQVRTDTVVNTPAIPVEHQYEVLIRQRQAAESVGIRLPPIPGLPAEPVPQPTP